MNHSFVGWGLALSASFLLGTLSITGKVALKYIGFNLITFLQLFFASLTFLFLFLRQKRKKNSEYPFKLLKTHKKDLASLIIGGVFGLCFFRSFYYLSLESIPASENGFIRGLTPIFILSVSFFFYRGRFTRRQILSSLTAFLGVSYLMTDPTLPVSGFNKGHIFCFLAILLYALFVHDRFRLSKNMVQNSLC